MEDNNKSELFSSGFIWIVTCVLVSSLPTLLTYIYLCISEEKIIDTSEYFTDILLIVFSISCSLFSLLCDKSKLFNIKLKRKGIVFSIFIAIISGTYYFYLTGKNETGNKLLLKFLLVSIIICSIFGYCASNDYDKSCKEIELKKLRESEKEKQTNKKNNNKSKNRK